MYRYDREGERGGGKKLHALRSTRNRNPEASTNDSDRRRRERREEDGEKRDGEAKRFLSRVYLVRTRKLYLHSSKVNTDVAHGMSETEKERVERKRTKESSVDAEEVVERARIPGKHGKVGN